MPALQQHFVQTGFLSSVAGEVAKGKCLVLDAAGTRLLVSTSANRTATGRKTACIALQNGDEENAAIETQFGGVLDPSVANVGEGTQDQTVYVDANGDLARGGTVGVDDIIGRCDSDGVVYFLCGGIAGAAGGTPLPGSTITNSSTGTLTDITSTDADGNASVIEWLGDEADTPTTIRSIAGGSEARQLVIINRSGGVGTLGDGANLTLANDVGTTAANRILTPSGEDLVLPPKHSAVLEYSENESRWYVVATFSQTSAVDNFLGVALNGVDGDTPPIGGTWAYNEQGTPGFKPQKPSHPGMFNVKDYGATGDGVTDDWDAITATLVAAQNGGNGAKVFFPEGTYRISKTIDVDAAYRIEGCGHGLFASTSLIMADAGVTAFRVWYAGGPLGFGGGASLFRNLSIGAAGRNTNTVNGTWDEDDPYTLTVDSAGDFANGQIISLEGAGPQVLLAECTAATTNGSPTVTFTDLGDQVMAFRAGQYLVIGAAYPNPTRIASVSGSTLTMASNAAASLAAATAYWCAPYHSRIVSGAGTTTWTIDDPQGVTSMTGVVKHVDAGFDIRVQCVLENVSVGANGGPFAGAGFLVRGSHGTTPASNANCMTISGCHSFQNRHALWVQGPDANACRFHVVSIQAADWAFVDLSYLGNLYTSLHADGGQGFITSQAPGCANVFVGCYLEGGTCSSLGPSSLVLGGTVPKFAGGHSYAQNVVNQLQIGDDNWKPYRTTFDPSTSFVTFVSNTGTPGIGMWFAKKAASGDPGVTGFFQWSHTATQRNHPLVFADTDQSAFKPGTAWLPHDFWHGEDSAFKNLDATYGGRLATVRLDPTGVEPGPLNRDPATGPYDNVYAYAFGANAPYWKKGDWIRDPSLLDGCPTRHVVEDGHRNPEWKPATTYGFAIVCPTVANHNGRIYANLGASGASHATTEPDWTTAPNLNDTVVDNGVTWTNVGAAAFTQPVELDGYLEYTMVADADESWTHSSRQFFCGSVKVSKTLAAGRTITLPRGRYKRWFWNATNQLLTFSTGSGNTVDIASGKAAWLQCTGSEFRRMTADVTP